MPQHNYATTTNAQGRAHSKHPADDRRKRNSLRYRVLFRNMRTQAFLNIYAAHTHPEHLVTTQGIGQDFPHANNTEKHQLAPSKDLRAYATGQADVPRTSSSRALIYDDDQRTTRHPSRIDGSASASYIRSRLSRACRHSRVFGSRAYSILARDSLYPSQIMSILIRSPYKRLHDLRALDKVICETLKTRDGRQTERDS